MYKLYKVIFSSKNIKNWKFFSGDTCKREIFYFRRIFKLFKYTKKIIKMCMSFHVIVLLFLMKIL